jgi:alanyl-tRNA synthetase
VTVDELRRAFLAYFEERGHRRIPSSSLIPHGDPTLLFTTAGMVQFKPYFMGLAEPPARRLTSIQRCFRTTDVESVGDATHLTAFEMLGNFSVGDYFKPEAIGWAWEFLTGVLKIDGSRLWATVFTTDDEAAALWAERGLPADRILRYTAEQGNWWGPPGDTGPMGPCSEMHYDWGKTPGCRHCEADTCHPDIGCGRFLEIWNLVFMTYYREEDGSQTDLPAANIDTGAGLERLASVTQGARTLYETDELHRLVAVAERVSGRKYDADESPEIAFALRAMTEHSRALAFLATDGVLPSNEGRGYVLRRLLRRAIYFGYKIGIREPFLEQMVDAAIDLSHQINPQMLEQREFIKRLARVEEARFLQTLDRGLMLLDEVIVREAATKRIPGRDAFTLYDTHGLPLELTVEVAQSHGYEVDRAGFDAEMELQRERSRGDETFTSNNDDRALRYAALGIETAFVGYDGLDARSEVLHLERDGEPVARLDTGETGEVVVRESPMYPEGGGQVGDHGLVVTPTGQFRVRDTQRFGETIVLTGEVEQGHIEVSAAAEARVDAVRRSDTARNHTGTHLLHAALRAVLGTHVRQAGSYVGPDRLRFDYTHPEAPTEAEMATVQRMVNAKIRADIRSETFVLGYEEAIARGAIAFFEDRYTDTVRMVEYCDTRGFDPEHMHTSECYSRELCGGTHLHATGEVGMLIVVSDVSIGAGLRRIEAVTGASAERFVEERAGLVNTLARRFKVPANEVLGRIDALEESLAAERKRVEEAERRASAGLADDLAARAEQIGGTSFVIARIEAESPDALRGISERLRKLGIAFVFLAANAAGRPAFVAAASDDVIGRGLRADEVVRVAATLAGGGGGGRPNFAQAGGKDASQIDAATEAARKAVLERLGG